MILLLLSEIGVEVAFSLTGIVKEPQSDAGKPG